MNGNSKKRKIESENRAYNDRWEHDYLIMNNNGKLQCLVCLQVLSVPKEYNMKRHYSTLHEEKYNTYGGESRNILISQLKKKVKQQTGIFTKISHDQSAALYASFVVSLELAKAKKPFSDGNLVKKCAIEMAKAFGDAKLGEKFDSVPLSCQTIQRRIIDMGEQVEKSLIDLVKKSTYFSLCIDESTDQTDVSQLLIFIRVTQEDFSTKEELLEKCPMTETTKGKDIYEAVKNAVNKIGGFKKCSAIVTDGAPAMVGEKSGLTGMLRENGVTCPTIHCIIHRGALCGKSVKQNQVFKLVIKVINMIRGGNRALLHRKLKLFLEEMEAEYGDLLLYNHVRWLSAGKCLERFFGIRKDIPAFLNKFVSADTTQLEEELQSVDFLKELAFLTDITTHLNELNLNLQGRNKLMLDLIGNVNGFRNKLKIFKLSLSKNDLSHFSSCRKLAEESEDDGILDFSEFAGNIQEIIEEFDTRFKDFESLKSSMLLFSNPIRANIEDQPTDLQLELCDLQADTFLQTRDEKGADFFKLLTKERFPNLRDFGQRITSMFGSTYLCESVFSALKFIKNHNRSRLTDSSLLHLLRLSTTELEVDIHSLVVAADKPQFSH